MRSRLRGPRGSLLAACAALVAFGMGAGVLAGLNPAGAVQVTVAPAAEAAADAWPGTAAAGSQDEAKGKTDVKKPDAKKPDSTKPDSKNPPRDVPPVPPPATPNNLSAQVDPLADYQGQAICDVNPKTGTDKFIGLIKATYQTVGDIWAPRDCSEGNRSEHKEYRAFDWMINSRVPEEKAQAQSLLDWLLATDANGNRFAMARRLGVMYIGWDDRIWESYTQRWSELKGCFSTPQPDYDTYCHRNHVHISLSWDGAAGLTSFWGGNPNPLPYCDEYASASSDVPPFGNGLSFLPISPTRVLDTRSGLGVPGGSACRISAESAGVSAGGGGAPGAPIVLTVADLPGAPEGGARAVAVRVAAVDSNAPATLRSVTGGSAALTSVIIGGRREVVTILPVASDGTVAFTTDSGATGVVVDVLGYFVKPLAAPDGSRLLAQSGQVAYDTTALKQPLAAGEKRVISLAQNGTSDGPPTGALVSVDITSGSTPGQLIVRRPSDRRTAATPTISYHRNSQISTNLLVSLDAKGNVVLVNAGKAPINVRLALQASAVRAPELGSLLVPVTPATLRSRQTTLTRALGLDRTRTTASTHSTPGRSGDEVAPSGLSHQGLAALLASTPAMPTIVGSTGSAAAATAPGTSSAASGATAALLQVTARAPGKGGSVTFWSLSQPDQPSLVVPRMSSVSSLVMVPLDVKGDINKTVVGGPLQITATIVAYLK